MNYKEKHLVPKPVGTMVFVVADQYSSRGGIDASTVGVAWNSGFLLSQGRSCM